MTDQAPVITIDGPSGSGKGTIGRLVAQRLGWHFLDSGALYRLLGCAALKHGIALDDEQALAAAAAELDVAFTAGDDAEPRILLEGEDVSRAIRSEEAGRAASQVASVPAVREALLDRQRAFQQAPGLVADGRDMGTVVFPDAPVKIFLTASVEERANRRYNQLKDKGVDANLRQISADIRERDERDSSRGVAPLAAAADAVVVDTSDLTIESVEAEIIAIARARLGQ